jgi:hypothetical protein
VNATCADLYLPVLIAFETLMDAPVDAAKLLDEGDVGNDRAVAELVVLIYSKPHRQAFHCLRRAWLARELHKGDQKDA